MRTVLIAAGIAGWLVAMPGASMPAHAADDYLDCYKGTVADPSDRGIAVCTRLIKSGKYKGADLRRLLSNRGLIYTKLDKLDLAMADLDRAVKIDPDAYSYDNRGDVWRRLGKNDQAIVDYNMAIRLDPTFVAAYLDRGHAFKAIGNRKSALADYQAVLDMPDKGRAIDKWAKKEAKDAIAALDKE